MKAAFLESKQYIYRDPYRIAPAHYRFFHYHLIIFGHIKCIKICNPVSSRAHKLGTWILLFAYVLFFAKCIKESSNLSTLRCLNILQGQAWCPKCKHAQFHRVYNITKLHIFLRYLYLIQLYEWFFKHFIWVLLDLD